MAKVIVGQVSNTGTVNFGAISSSRRDEGVFDVTYNNPFHTEPAVVVTTKTDQVKKASGVNISNSTAEGFTVAIKDMAGNLVNRSFNLIATAE